MHVALQLITALQSTQMYIWSATQHTASLCTCHIKIHYIYLQVFSFVFIVACILLLFKIICMYMYVLGSASSCCHWSVIYMKILMRYIWSKRTIVTPSITIHLCKETIVNKKKISCFPLAYIWWWVWTHILWGIGI